MYPLLRMKDKEKRRWREKARKTDIGRKVETERERERQQGEKGVRMRGFKD